MNNTDPSLQRPTVVHRDGPASIDSMSGRCGPGPIRTVLFCVGLWPILLWPSAAGAQAAKGAAVPRARAVELYAANCQICHGPDGTGTPLMKDLAFVARGKWKHGSTARAVAATITNGVPATPMLPFKGRLTPAEINALAALVRSYDKTLKPAAARGKD
jgi:mono/diheme cytochrome c family protein